MRIKYIGRIFAVTAISLLLATTTRGANTNLSHHVQWEPAIRAFERSDKTNPPPKDAVLLIGSSSIRKWTNAAAQLPGHEIINRGFGGSHLGDSVVFAERIVIPYQPKVILLYAGDNDIAAGKSAEQIFADYEAFVKKIRAALPETRIAFISIKPSPSREEFSETVKTANRLIRKFTEQDGKLIYVDVYAPMLTAEGRARPELFVGDRLHLNEAGYKLWAGIVKPVLDKVDPPSLRKP